MAAVQADRPANPVDRLDAPASNDQSTHNRADDVALDSETDSAEENLAEFGQSGDEGSPSTASAASDYPEGPYGLAVGQTTKNLNFLTSEDSRLDLATIRTVSNHRMMVLFTTAAWCARCARHMPSINQLHADYAASGLLMAAAIYEGRTYNPPTAKDLVAYKRSFGIDGLILGDTDGAVAEYFGGPTKPMVLVFDLSTMEILYIHDEWLPDEITTLVDEHL